MMLLPEICLTTDRLVLRTPLEQDFDPVLSLMQSDRSRFIGGPLDDEFSVWRGFLGSVGHWAMMGYGMFTVLHNGDPVGRVGIVNHRGWQEPELGWHVFNGCEGQGYATEAGRAARAWAFHQRGLGPLISYIDPANTPSQGVARRLGATVECDGELLGKPCQIWRHPDPRQEAPHGTA